MRNRTPKRNLNPSRNRAIIILTLLLAPLVAYCCFYKYSLTLKEASAHKSFILTITSTMENRNPKGKEWLISDEEKAISLFMNNTWQTVYILNTSHPINKICMDENGNPIAFLSLPNKILCGENITYKVTYKIILTPRSLPAISENRSGKLSDIDRELKEEYCKAESPWQVNNEELRSLAFKIAGNETNVLLLLEKFIRWIREKIRYYHPEIPRYPNETVEYMSGDCDDQANLLITFCRIIGIPAYLQLGCIYIPQRDLERSYWEGHLMLRLTRIGWHGWAVVYVPPWGWLPVDLTCSSRSDPLSAIKEAAIITHWTVQYENLTKNDYVASSRRYREFLISNNFRIYEHDVMIQEKSRKYGGIVPLIFTAFVYLSSIIKSPEKKANTYKMVYYFIISKFLMTEGRSHG